MCSPKFTLETWAAQIHLIIEAGLSTIWDFSCIMMVMSFTVGTERSFSETIFFFLSAVYLRRCISFPSKSFKRNILGTSLRKWNLQGGGVEHKKQYTFWTKGKNRKWKRVLVYTHKHKYLRLYVHEFSMFPCLLSLYFALSLLGWGQKESRTLLSSLYYVNCLRLSIETY